jgi:hypothetical protein
MSAELLESLETGPDLLFFLGITMSTCLASIYKVNPLRIIVIAALRLMNPSNIRIIVLSN